MLERIPPAAEAKATPMIAQYRAIKAAHPDCLLFYRMGDFYELFFEDAETAAKALNILLTKRGKHEGQDIPMCGVPVERAEDYLARLIAQGFRVAICEQTEDPAETKKRGGKALVKREVVRLVTPGTITEEHLLDPARRLHSWRSKRKIARSRDRALGARRDHSARRTLHPLPSCPPCAGSGPSAHPVWLPNR